MANFFVPSKQIFTPELLIPGRKPVGPVVLDRSKQGIISKSTWWPFSNSTKLQDVSKKNHLINSGGVLSHTGLTFSGSGNYASVSGAGWPSSQIWIAAHIYLTGWGTLVGANRFGRLTRRASCWDLMTVDTTTVNDGIQWGGVASAANVLTLGAWYWVEVWDNGTNSYLYVDGKQVGSGISLIASGSADVYVGNYDGATDRQFMGTIETLLISSGKRDSNFIKHPYSYLKPPGPEYLTFSTGAAPPASWPKFNPLYGSLGGPLGGPI